MVYSSSAFHPIYSHLPTCVPTLSSTAEVMPQFNGVPPSYLILTAKEEQQIVATNHPYKDYVLQSWDTLLESCVQQNLPQEAGTLSRTSSEELRSIFGIEDTDKEEKEEEEILFVVEEEEEEKGEEEEEILLVVEEEEEETESDVVEDKPSPRNISPMDYHTVSSGDSKPTTVTTENELSTILNNTDEYSQAPNGSSSAFHPIYSHLPTCVPTLSSTAEVMPQFNGVPPSYLILTAKEEQQIVATNHPYKDSVLKSWDTLLESCVQQNLPQEALSRTSSEEELRSIFGIEDSDKEEDF